MNEATGFDSSSSTIVGHDAFHGDAEAFEIGDGGEEQGDGAFVLLVGEDVGTCDTRMIVDRNVNEFPACALAAALAGAASGDAVADAAEAAELLNVEMDYLARLLALVAWAWRLRLEAGEQAEATMFENARDAGSGDAELSRDVLLGAALSAQSLDVIGCSEADLAWQRMGF